MRSGALSVCSTASEKKFDRTAASAGFAESASGTYRTFTTPSGTMPASAYPVRSVRAG
jgi:hypothetical protein